MLRDCRGLLNERGGKLLKNFFDTNNEKITEKAFTHSLIVSILGMILCIVALCSATFAWFTTETTSESNTLISGTFDLDVSVTYNSAAPGEQAEIFVTEDEKGKKSCTLDRAGSYTVTLKLSDDATVKGFCGVILNGGEQQFTAPLSEDPDVGVTSITFTLEATAANSTLELIPRWGYPSFHSIVEGSVVPVAQSSESNE